MARQNVQISGRVLSVGFYLVSGTGPLLVVDSTVPPRVYKFADFDNLATNTTKDYTLASGNYLECRTADYYNGFLYISFDPFNDGLDNCAATVSKIDVSALTASDLFTRSAIGTAGVTLTGTRLCVDGPNNRLYLGTVGLFENGWLYSYNLTTGAQVASRQLSGTNRFSIRDLHSDGSNLYFTGQRAGQQFYVGKAALDLSSETTVLSGVTAGPDNLVMVGSDIWVSYGSTSLYKIPKTLTGGGTVATGSSKGSQYLYYDGTYIWTATNGDPADFYAFNPADNTIKYSFTLNSGEKTMNACLPTTSPAYGIGWGGTTGADSQIVAVPMATITGAAATVTGLGGGASAAAAMGMLHR